MRPRITEIAEQILRECRAAGTVDLMTSFAFPLPVAVLCELMGIPQEDRPEILEQFAVVTRSRFDPSRKAELKAAEERLQHRLERLIADTRAHPSDSFLSDLLQGEEQLEDPELVASLWVLFFAGHKTTAYQIGNSVLNLLLRPDQAALLREDPALVPRAVEEMLRFEGSVETSTFRYAAQDAEIRGTRIPEGSLVQIAISSANRDPEKFDLPDELDVTREGLQGTHLGFGHGTHYCLGRRWHGSNSRSRSPPSCGSSRTWSSPTRGRPGRRGSRGRCRRSGASNTSGSSWSRRGSGSRPRPTRRGPGRGVPRVRGLR